MLKGMDKFENALGLNNSYEILDDHTQKAMEELYKKAERHKESYLWYTNWQIILKENNITKFYVDKYVIYYYTLY